MQKLCSELEFARGSFIEVDDLNREAKKEVDRAKQEANELRLKVERLERQGNAGIVRNVWQ